MLDFAEGSLIRRESKKRRVGMLVKNWMNTHVVTVDAEGSLHDLASLTKHRDKDLVPVMAKGKLVGVVTEKELRKAMGAEASSFDACEPLLVTANIRIRDVMNASPVTIPFDDTIEEAVQILLDENIRAAPVVDQEGALRGIITEHDIFRVMVSLTGVRNRGIQIAFELEDVPLSIKEVEDIIRGYGCRVVSIMSTIQEQTGYRHVYIRACECDRERLGAMIEELRSKVNLLYMVDYRENRKVLYKEYTRPPAEYFLG